jgi:hypothetical protein
VWVHVAVVEYNGTLALYLNGTLAQSTTATGSLWFNSRLVASMVLGERESTSFITTGVALLLDAGSASSYSGTGTTWTDLSGRGNAGVLTNGPTYSSANWGFLAFDGANDFARGTIQATTFQGAHTISCWFNRAGVNNLAGIFSNINSECAILSFGTTINNTPNSVGIFRIGLDAAGVWLDLGADHLNQWIHVTMVVSGVSIGSKVTLYAYKNGALLSSSGNLYWTLSSFSSYSVGSSVGAAEWLFNGRISHVAVYNRALTATEVDQNYNALKGRYTTGAVSERFAGNMQDVRVYTAAKYTSNFQAAFTPMPNAGLSNITRVGQTLQVPIVATSYRRARLFVGAKIASGVSVEMSTTTTPAAYVYPTTVTSASISTAYRAVATPVVFRVAPYDALNAGTAAVYLTDASGVLSAPTLVGQGTLDTSGNLRAPSCVFPMIGSAFTLYVRAVSPEGAVQGSFAASAGTMPIAVVEPGVLMSSIASFNGTSDFVNYGDQGTVGSAYTIECVFNSASTAASKSVYAPIN